MGILEQAIEKLQGSVIPGETVFRLYDTYGFPLDLTADVAREQGLTLDREGFDKAMEEQKSRARSASSFGGVEKLVIDLASATEFIGYDHLQGQGTVQAIYQHGQPVKQIAAGAEADLILDNSPFYGESGGQIGDCGTLQADGKLFEVIDTQKQGDYLIHRGVLQSGELHTGDLISAQVLAENRAAITLNHSATHLMHAALRQVLGSHVAQKGSLVTADRLRFDFSHPSSLTEPELREVEELVNGQILANSEVSKEVMSMDDARQKGALALFGEKYGDQVRVVSMGDQFSTELCGGCHVQRTGDIGVFKIVSEAGIAAGVRRIEAVTGRAVLELVNRREQTLSQLEEIVKASEEGLVDKVRQLASQTRSLEKQLEQLKAKLASSAGSDIASQAKEVNGVKLLAARLEGFNAKSLRDTVDQLKNKLGAGSVIVLASEEDGKVSLVAGVTADLTDRIKAGELVSMVANQVGGKGGGRPDMAMAGGSDAAALPAALQSVEPWLSERL
jgi:alanyl-tRNA synthetase